MDLSDLKKVVGFGFEVGNLISIVKNLPGGPAAKLIAVLSSATPDLMALLSLDAGKALQEYKNLDVAGRQELLDYAKQKFDIADDVLEVKVENAFGLLLESSALVEKWIALAKS